MSLHIYVSKFIKSNHKYKNSILNMTNNTHH